MSPRLDAVEEVTVTTAGNGADSNAMGSTQIQFTTRSGSNLFSGSGYYYYQSEKLNTNTYFNKLARPAEERRGAAPAGRPRRRPGRHPEASTTAAARRSSS